MDLPLFLIPLLSGLIAQALKPFLNQQWYTQLTPDSHKIPRYGGMPSAHTAFIFSLATTIGVIDGLYSTTFAIAAVLVVLVLDDALRMRIFLSRHGLALSQLVHKLPTPEQKTYPYLESRLGHKPLEVLAGGALGIALSLIFLALGRWILG